MRQIHCIVSIRSLCSRRDRSRYLPICLFVCLFFFFSSNLNSASFNTILQQYCDIFVTEYNFRQFYFPFACALAFPRCNPLTGGPLLLCPSGPSGCDSKLPGHICTSQIPVAQLGDPCTPIGDPFFVTSFANALSSSFGGVLLLAILFFIV